MATLAGRVAEAGGRVQTFPALATGGMLGGVTGAFMRQAPVIWSRSRQFRPARHPFAATEFPGFFGLFRPFAATMSLSRP